MTALHWRSIIEASSEQTKKAFDAEVTIMSQLHHRNILSLKGWCKEDTHLLLIYEKVENGNLEDHLYPENGTMDSAVYGGTDNGTRLSSNLGWPIRYAKHLYIYGPIIYINYSS